MIPFQLNPSCHYRSGQQSFSGPLCRKRLEADYLSRVQEYASELVLSLKELGKTGPFWIPE